MYTLHGFFTDDGRRAAIDRDCRTGALGCVDCKRELAEGLVKGLAPIRERYLAVRKDEAGLRQLLAEGAERARGIARETLALARERMGLREGGRTA